MTLKEEGFEQVGKRPACLIGPLLPGREMSVTDQSINRSRILEPLNNIHDSDSNSSTACHQQSTSYCSDVAISKTTLFPLPNYEEVIGSSESRKQPLALPAPDSYNSTQCDNNSNLDENNHLYVGLVNQAMTCYLNSLIQTLYMTPEFRNAIYTWKFSGKLTEESKNIPYQLQKLFLLLQTSDKSSLETKDLTASFGWESNDAYDQHDVQELCRLMFDALEHRWKKTENCTLIQDLYKGNVEDYVKCLRCHTEKIKPDVFLDLPLAVRNFGAKESFKSIEEALRAFIKPEILDEQNKYFCEPCNSKQIAEKGLRITHFPYILTIQLKRFDFDYNTHYRIKLNDNDWFRMTFPDFLDLNDYVYASNKNLLPKMSYANAASKTSSSKKNTEMINNLLNQENNENKDQVWLSLQRNSNDVKQFLKKGKYIYELLSIMVHQGNASGGHYFAYIKNLDQDRWFCFNDSSVQSATLADIHRTFGSPSGGWSNINTNAYMLMYRQVDFDQNKKFISTKELPPHLIDLKEKLVKDEAERERQQRFQEEHVKVYYIYNHEDYIECDPHTTNIHKDVPLRSALDMLADEFEKSGDTFDADVETRLILCNSSWMMKQWLENLDDTIESIVGIEFFRCEVYLLIDTKPSWVNANFYRFSVGSKTFDVSLVDLEHKKIQVMRRFCLDEQLTIGELRKMMIAIPQIFNSGSVDQLRIVVDPAYDENTSLIVLNDDSQTLLQAKIPFIYGKLQLYIDWGPFALLKSDRMKKNFTETKMYQIIDHKKFSTKIKICLPTPEDFVFFGMEPRKLKDFKEEFDALPPLPPKSEILSEIGDGEENNENAEPEQCSIKTEVISDSMHSSVLFTSSSESTQALTNSSAKNIYWNNSNSYSHVSTNVVYSSDNDPSTSSILSLNKQGKNSNRSSKSSGNILPNYNFSVSNTFGNKGFPRSMSPDFEKKDLIPPPPYSPIKVVLENNTSENLKAFNVSEPSSSVSTTNDNDCMDTSESPCGSTPKRSPIVSENEGSVDEENYHGFSLYDETKCQQWSPLLYSDYNDKFSNIQTKLLDVKKSQDNQDLSAEYIDGQTLCNVENNDKTNNKCIPTYSSRIAKYFRLQEPKNDESKQVVLCLPEQKNQWNSRIENENDSGAECEIVGAGGDDFLSKAGDDSVNDGSAIAENTTTSSAVTTHSELPDSFAEEKDEGLVCDTEISGQLTSTSDGGVAKCGIVSKGVSSTSLLMSNIFLVKILEIKEDNTGKPYVLVEVDRRLLSVHFKLWISRLLSINFSNFNICTHYNENDEGFVSNFAVTDTVRDNFVTANYVSVKLNNSSNASDISNDTDCQDKSTRGRFFGSLGRLKLDLNHNNSSAVTITSSRRERPLRIQMASFSENE